MESSKVIHAFYTDDEVLLDAVKTVKAAHHHIEEVFCPFPVHGLDKAMGLAPTRLSHYCIFVWNYRFSFCYLDDQLYDDRRLATRHWWKTKF